MQEDYERSFTIYVKINLKCLTNVSEMIRECENEDVESRLEDVLRADLQGQILCDLDIHTHVSEDVLYAEGIGTYYTVLDSRWYEDDLMELQDEIEEKVRDMLSTEWYDYTLEVWSE